MGSFNQPWTLPPLLSAAALALVRDITDDPERRNARRQSVLGDIGQVADCRELPHDSGHLTAP